MWVYVYAQWVSLESETHQYLIDHEVYSYTSTEFIIMVLCSCNGIHQTIYINNHEALPKGLLDVAEFGSDKLHSSMF